MSEMRKPVIESEPNWDRNEREPQKRFKFSLATFFWIMFSFACFFAGMQFDELNFGSDEHRIRLKKGRSHIITKAETTISRAMVGDPNILAIVPISSNQIRLGALLPGATDVTAWDQVGNYETYDVIVK